MMRSLESPDVAWHGQMRRLESSHLNRHTHTRTRAHREGRGTWRAREGDRGSFSPAVRSVCRSARTPRGVAS